MKWEYKIIKHQTKGISGGSEMIKDLEREMNDLGAEGWELNRAVSPQVDHDVHREVILFFKRPLEI